MNKKAILQDEVFIVLLVFATVIGGLLAVKLLTMINTKVQAMPDSQMPEKAKEAMSTYSTRLPKWVDGAVIFIFIMMQLVALFLALQIPTNPVFLPISAIVYVIITGISYFFSIIYNRISTAAAVTSANASMPISAHLMSNLHIFSFVFGVIILGVMVAKK